MIERLKKAWRALWGCEECEVTAPLAVELLQMESGDKLIICFAHKLSLEKSNSLRDHFVSWLEGDKQVAVLGDEVPKFIVVRGWKRFPS